MQVTNRRLISVKDYNLFYIFVSLFIHGMNLCDRYHMIRVSLEKINLSVTSNACSTGRVCYIPIRAIIPILVLRHATERKSNQQEEKGEILFHNLVV